MSDWVHIAAVFRLDFTAEPTPMEAYDIGERLGYHHDTGCCDIGESGPGESYPQGSEYFADWEILRPGWDETKNHQVVVVYGDLSDVSTLNGIEDWFYASCKRFGGSLVQACCDLWLNDTRHRTLSWMPAYNNKQEN